MLRGQGLFLPARLRPRREFQLGPFGVGVLELLQLSDIFDGEYITIECRRPLPTLFLRVRSLSVVKHLYPPS